MHQFCVVTLDIDPDSIMIQLVSQCRRQGLVCLGLRMFFDVLSFSDLAANAGSSSDGDQPGDSIV